MTLVALLATLNIMVQRKSVLSNKITIPPVSFEAVTSSATATRTDNADTVIHKIMNVRSDDHHV